MLVPVNVCRCWVFAGLSRKFEEPWHFKQVPFLRTSASFTGQLWVCREDKAGSSSHFFDHILLSVWDTFYCSTFQTFLCTWFTWELMCCFWLKRSREEPESLHSFQVPSPVDATGSTDLEQLGFEEILLKGVCCVHYPRGLLWPPFRTALTLAEVLECGKSEPSSRLERKLRRAKSPVCFVPSNISRTGSWAWITQGLSHTCGMTSLLGKLSQDALFQASSETCCAKLWWIWVFQWAEIAADSPKILKSIQRVSFLSL